MRPDPLDVDGAAIAAAVTSEAGFSELTRRYRRELHVHCYRMLGSFEDAEDLVQETFLRAWQKRATYEGRASFRAWLYRIATNACLDFLEKHRRQIAESELQTTGEGHRLPPHVSWLQPYPDRLLDQVAPREAEGDAQVIAKETIELAFLIALQFLPGRQRAALILCDVLDCSASEAASLLETSIPSVNGSLRRARAALRERRSWNDAATLRSRPDARERALLEEYVAANERCDVPGLAKLLREDVRWSMPPVPNVFAGRDTVVDSWVQGGFGKPPYDDWKCVISRANRMPAVMNYLRQPGDGSYKAVGVDVLRIEEGVIAEIVSFDVQHLIDAFGLPPTLE